VRDPEQDGFDLAGPEVGVKLAERDGTPEGLVRGVEPTGGLVAVSEDGLGQGRDPPDAEEAVGLVRPKAPGLLPASQRARGQVKEAFEIPGGDLEPVRHRLERPVGQAGPEAGTERIRRADLPLEDRGASQRTDDASG